MGRVLRILAISVAVAVLAAVVAVVAAFVQENGTWVVVKVPILGASISEPIAWVTYDLHLGGALVGSFMAGLLGVLLLLLIPLSLRRAFERRRRDRVIGSLEGELSDLRNLPLNDPAPYEDIDEAPVGAKIKGAREPRRRGEKADTVDDDDDDALLIAALQEASADPKGARGS